MKLTYSKESLDNMIILQEKESGMILVKKDIYDTRDDWIEIPMLVGVLECLQYEVYFIKKETFENGNLPTYWKDKKFINKNTYNALTYEEYSLLLLEEIYNSKKNKK